jgi:chromosome segregation ATPase
MEISNKQNEAITNLENKLITIQNLISSLEEKFIFNKQQYTAIQEEQENKLTTIQNTVSFVQENLTFARRQTAEIQLAVQDEQKLRQNKSNEINDLKKHIDSTTDSLQTKLTEQEKYFENKLSCFLQELETSKEAGKKQFETIEKLKYDFESKLIKAKTEQELNFLNYQKQEHEKTLKVQRDLFEIEKQIFKLNENNFYTDILKK